jgi:arsenate reductase
MKRIYHLSSCSTCKKIIQEINPPVDVELIDIKISNIDEETLDWLKKYHCPTCNGDKK